jgi:endonuclease YncB( thermonuclease family)
MLWTNTLLGALGGTALLWALPFAVVAVETWEGRVVAVHDGDTLSVMHGRRPVRVRLDQIDAPEFGQPFGRRAKASLAEICFGATAIVRFHGRDRYGRALGDVRCGAIGANAEQVRRGYAWFYRDFGKDTQLLRLEGSARRLRAGLWSHANPLPPWEFRRDVPHRTEARPLARPDVRCESRKTCREMTSCAEAMAYLRACGMLKLDGNRDGVPCEALCR